MARRASGTPTLQLCGVKCRETHILYGGLTASVRGDPPRCVFLPLRFAGLNLLFFFQALQFLQKNSSKYHFRRTKMLPVSGGFHTRLMEPAVEPLVQVLKAIDVKKPLVSVHSNVDGNRYTHPKHIQKLLAQQVVSPVKWEQTMHAIYERRKGTAFPQTFEVGPGKQLGAILRSCNLQAWRSYSHVEVLEAGEDPEEPL